MVKIEVSYSQFGYNSAPKSVSFAVKLMFRSQFIQHF